MRAQPYRVSVSGTAANGRLRLNLKLPDAEESNELTPCGSNYDVTASNTQLLDGSLKFVGGRALSIALKNGASLKLAKHDDYSFDNPDAHPPGKGTGSSDHAWTLRLRRAS